MARRLAVNVLQLAHPDLHFAFPIYKKDSSKNPRSDDFIDRWRSAITENPYLTLNQWMEYIGAENQQGLIYASQSEEIIRKLTLKSSEGGYKVMIIWMAEKMNTECSNKLLKMIEEPPAQTVFLLVAENPDLLLPTIQSRVQRLTLRPIEEEVIAHLGEQYRDMIHAIYIIGAREIANLKYNERAISEAIKQREHFNEVRKKAASDVYSLMTVGNIETVKNINDTMKMILDTHHIKPIGRVDKRYVELFFVVEDVKRQGDRCFALKRRR